MHLPGGSFIIHYLLQEKSYIYLHPLPGCGLLLLDQNFGDYRTDLQTAASVAPFHGDLM